MYDNHVIIIQGHVTRSVIPAFPVRVFLFFRLLSPLSLSPSLLPSPSPSPSIHSHTVLILTLPPPPHVTFHRGHDLFADICIFGATCFFSDDFGHFEVLPVAGSVPLGTCMAYLALRKVFGDADETIGRLGAEVLALHINDAGTNFNHVVWNDSHTMYVYTHTHTHTHTHIQICIMYLLCSLFLCLFLCRLYPRLLPLSPPLSPSPLPLPPPPQVPPTGGPPTGAGVGHEPSDLLVSAPPVMSSQVTWQTLYNTCTMSYYPKLSRLTTNSSWIA